MRREILFSMKSPFRDTFRIQGFRFGSGAKSLAIVGAMRGDEVQQQYICSQLVKQLVQLEAEGRLVPGHEILVIPSANPYSMNIGKRFWAMDNTDINRMFPGYDQGETTQRIAAALFEAIQGYTFGVQLASFYVPGDFIPHIRIIRTGYEDVQTASLFGLPYVCLRKSLPFDTTLLNYNWQIWDTKAYSVYGGQNGQVEGPMAPYILGSLLRFMQRTSILVHTASAHPGYDSQVIDESDLTSVKAPVSGIFYRMKTARDEVRAGELLACIIHPEEGEVLAEIHAPADGIIFFAHNQPLTLQEATLYKLYAR
ncbi:succinylglutamate desuccinylase/aspartoacylase family protein [Bacteroides sp. An51A]|uniref:succinylglutamate desuccinylase/aspartoacylase domain-containing protein n=1 Tax=Bacteroides sp. An51A TaxID=1965640 RepID=UPI000B394D70|nr:succinylglutamate desuccinylase/aspartoacylase family protein [Bacteroides sp. An51A]OUN82227.1 succinylglutamate desuccinylase [Bacteroides sp. An51A]